MADKTINLYHTNSNVNIPVKMVDNGDGTFAQQFSAIAGGAGDKIVNLYHDNANVAIPVLMADQGDGTFAQRISVVGGGGGGGSGTVTSVGLTMPAEFAVASSPVTTAGTIAVTKATQAANLVYAGPSSGGAVVPTFRALALADLPASIAAATAATLATPRAINGTSFDGSAAITVTADASTLTGATLNATVLASSLTSVGVLAAPHLTSAVIDSGGLTITTGSLVVSAGSANSIVGVATSGGATLLTLTPGAHTNVTAEASNVVYTGVTQTITGGYATQRFIRLGQPTISAATSLTVTTAATFAISGAPIAAGVGPAVITTPLALWVQAGTTRLDGGLTFGAAANVVAVSNTASALQFTDGTNAYHVIDTRTTVTGVVAHSLSATGPTIASASGVTYSVVKIPAVTTTLTGVTTVTALNGLALNLAQPTVTDASAVTVTTSSTLYIAGAPIAAGSATLTTPLALHVGGGNVQIDGVDLRGNAVGGLNIRALQNNLNFFTSGQFFFQNATINLGDAGNIAFGSTTGTKIGTATTQKLSIWNATPIVQPSAVGTSTGFAAGTTAVTFHSDDTYTGNVGSTAYTLNGVVAALKNFGLLAA